MVQARIGDRVRVDYTARLPDGTIYDTTFGEQCTGDDCETGPVELILGKSEIFTRVDDAMVGMSPGERKTVTVGAAETFGNYDVDMVFTVPRDQIPGSIDPSVGLELELVDDAGESVVVQVIEVTAESIVLDANHPLTGKDVTFDLELVEIL